MCEEVHFSSKVAVTEVITEASEWDSHTSRPSFFDLRDVPMSLHSVLGNLLSEETLSSVERNFIQLETDRLFPVYKRYELLSLEEEAVKKRDGFKRYTVNKYHQSAEEIIADGHSVRELLQVPLQTDYRFTEQGPETHAQAGRRLSAYLEGGVVSEIVRDWHLFGSSEGPSRQR